MNFATGEKALKEAEDAGKASEHAGKGSGTGIEREGM